MADLKTYQISGVLQMAVPLDINRIEVEAYSIKQARFKLSFELQKRFPQYQFTIKDWMMAVKRARLSIREL